jgi:signal transduction histidine kinase
MQDSRREPTSGAIRSLGTMSPFVTALREARARIAAADHAPAEAAVARRIERELDQTIARLEGGEADKDLIAVVCHDLKDPLASIVMGAGFLRKAVTVEDVAAKRVVEAIARSADRMGQVVADFHDLAKLEAGRLSVERQPCDVVAVLKGTLVPFETLAKEKGVDLEVDMPASLTIACDRARLGQIVGKLLGNALKFTPAGGHVAVKVAPEGEGVAVTVKDDGRGISSDRLPTIFDHGANARRTPRDGPGLGLAIARGLAELQGGAISVQSQPGEGSVFTFTLPG